MDTIEETKFEISNSCACMDCPECGVGTESLQCEDCDKPTTPANYCDGYCFDYKLDWLSESVEEWTELMGNPSSVQINGRAMGWTRASGSATIPAEWKAIFNALQINGDWTLRFTIAGESFKVMRYSHDEPTGASFEIVPAVEESDDE